MMKVAAIMLGIVGLAICGGSNAWAAAESVLLSGGMAIGGGDEILISKFPDYSQPGNRFESNETVYVKVRSQRMLRLKGRNILYLLDREGKKTSFEALVVSDEIGVFKAELDLNNLEDELYYLELNLDGYGERNRKEQLNFIQEVRVGQVDRELSFRQPEQKEKVSLGVGMAKEMVFRISGDEAELKRASFFVNDFRGTRQPINNSAVERNGQVYDFSLALYDLNLEGGRWYFLSYDLEFKQGSRERGGKFFLSDFELPEAEITLPEAGGEVSGLIDVLGTVRDGELFYSYWLEILKEGEEGIILGEEHLGEVIDGHLGQWQSDDFDAGVYGLKIKAVDFVGNLKEFVLNNLVLGGGANKFGLKTPKKVEMTDIEVATYSQTSFGSIGEDDGKNGIEVEDSRGLYTGWSVTASFSDFVSESGETMGSGNLTVIPRDVQVIKGQSIGVYAGGLARPIENEAVSLMHADVGYGNGKYRQQVILNLDVPANPIAEEYQSTIVITLL